MENLPFSQACENNREVILEIISRVFSACDTVLEIGSGTGQHAAHFSQAMPWLRWQPTELPAHLPLLQPRCRAQGGDNLHAPIALDVCSRPWPLEPVPQGLFSANTLHIMPWNAVVELFAELGDRCQGGTVLAVYGPFNYGGEYTSPSNEQFDQWLFERDPRSAIRHFEKVDELAVDAGFSLREDNPMPANNRLLVWSKAPPTPA